MYKVKCANPKCDKGEDGGPADCYAYAINRRGDVPPQYCSDFCKAENNYDKRFISK